MASFQPHLAAIRFGTGRSEQVADPVSVAEMITRLTGPDTAAARYPIVGWDGLSEFSQEFEALKRERRSNPSYQEDYRAMTSGYRDQETLRVAADFAAVLARAVSSPDGFRERLALFWYDHFAARGKDLVMRRRSDGYVEDAIRPHVAGPFAALLKAAVLHPMMVKFLDQDVSIGPNSQFLTARKNRKGGLNENLAREILELHTMGVQGSYDQTDVRQLAELLAGVKLDVRREVIFDPMRAEPGAETVLDFTSRSWPSLLEDVEALLDRLAVHPDTAAHLSLKLATHFVSDAPDPDMVAAMTDRYLDTDGDLAQVYEAMLSHTAAMAPELTKVKRPIEFVFSTLRALSADPDRLVEVGQQKPKALIQQFHGPMKRMGQDWGWPGGPNGWPESDSEWITANALVERMRLSIRLQRFPGVRDVEPQALMYQALGPLADQRLSFAVSAAETREEAVALVLMSPAFQRR